MEEARTGISIVLWAPRAGASRLVLAGEACTLDKAVIIAAQT